MLEWIDMSQMNPIYTRAWIYGPPGTGKTTIAQFFPQPFFIFCHNEGSETTLRGQNFRGVRVGVPQNGAPHDAVAAVRGDIENLLDMMLSSAARGTLAQDFGETIVFDSVSHYNDLVIAEIVAGSKRKKMEQQDWGVLRAHLLHIRDVFWRLPAHILFTSFAQKQTAADGSLKYAGPSLAGSAAELLPGSCDALGYCETTPTGERQVYFRDWNGFPARHRYPGVSQGPIPNHQLWATIAPALGWGA